MKTNKILMWIPIVGIIVGHYRMAKGDDICELTSNCPAINGGYLGGTAGLIIYGIIVLLAG